MALSRRLRFEILRRDGYACRYCGAKAPDVQLTVDHVIPVTLGGGDDPSNLVTACQPCNAGKASVPADAALVEDVDDLALRFARAIESAAFRRRRRQDLLDVDLDLFDQTWAVWGHGEGEDRELVPRPDDWRDSIERFLAAGLNHADFGRLVNVAMRAKVPNHKAWRYFCGCCWRAITEIQEEARRLIEDGTI